mmetsp:Transcript_13216/g.32116  ORF Transcript_13216/g.32116 Transcript_13216/m.32116 type:complete len:124 (-) Transcript_13216:456-827(-)|eukprot:CAMPEP_0181119576 /NCGR_PEP_ID=MMETSP1071-20121207/23676_1 /TAXON_ID=35127 /ORGANISM="Thalassiosira sp., Strain NH16" /LENGTH=123 /DNA_ID=CAMNT_0023204133 /DNA_START=231 /DNA_END=602 /DNA_ORIENTATION=+
MKQIFHFIIVALIVVAPATISAFVPGKILGENAASNVKFARLNVKICMGRREAAKSKEEDIDLTRAIIMNHIESSDGLENYGDGGESDIVEPADVEGKKSLKKIKSIGTKIKKKLKSKLKKDE